MVGVACAHPPAGFEEATAAKLWSWCCNPTVVHVLRCMPVGVVLALGRGVLPLSVVRACCLLAMLQRPVQAGPLNRQKRMSVCFSFGVAWLCVSHTCVQPVYHLGYVVAFVFAGVFWGVVFSCCGGKEECQHMLRSSPPLWHPGMQLAAVSVYLCMHALRACLCCQDM